MAKYKCPKCGCTYSFNIVATALVEVDGETGYVEDREEFEWDGDSTCVCPNCYYEGKEREFNQERK